MMLINCLLLFDIILYVIIIFVFNYWLFGIVIVFWGWVIGFVFVYVFYFVLLFIGVIEIGEYVGADVYDVVAGGLQHMLSGFVIEQLWIIGQ